jgi:hypothetical protein
MVASFENERLWTILRRYKVACSIEVRALLKFILKSDSFIDYAPMTLPKVLLGKNGRLLFFVRAFFLQFLCCVMRSNMSLFFEVEAS